MKTSTSGKTGQSASPSQLMFAIKHVAFLGEALLADWDWVCHTYTTYLYIHQYIHQIHMDSNSVWISRSEKRFVRFRFSKKVLQ